MKISISILNALNILNNLDSLNADYLHIDMMDGEFVPNKSFEIEEIIASLKNVKTKLDIHIMVNDVYKYIDALKIINPEFITFHVEAVNNPVEVINYLHSLGIKAGMAIKPNTKISEIEKYLNILDLVLVMSVEPGKGGQSFMPISIEKVNTLSKVKDKKYLIEVDGGINNETIKLISNADIAVIGSYITKDIKNYNKIKEDL